MQLDLAKDPDAALFGKLDSLQPCEVSELRGGTHIFAVYGRGRGGGCQGRCHRRGCETVGGGVEVAGDNFFKNTPYSLEVVDAREEKEAKQRLRDVEEQLVTKRNELRKFETEYREVRIRVSLACARHGCGVSVVVTRARHVRTNGEEGDSWQCVVCGV